jgi:putative NADH-flavin reductase
MHLKVIITGSTGMVGNGILLVCLNHPDVKEVLAINRRPSEISSPKLKEIIHQNFFDLSPIENQLSGYDACFYCLGVTSFLIKESQYYEITHDLTLSFANKLAGINPNMTFCYVSGFGANSPDKAKFMQAKVKGLTETDLFKTSFKKIYSFRPGLLKPVRGQKYVHKVYYLFNPFYPFFHLLFPGFVLSLKELGLAMINSVTTVLKKQILEVIDIVSLSKSN